MNQFAATAVSSCGRQTLCYLEPDGEDIIMHNVMEVPGLGQVDLTLTLKLVDERGRETLDEHIVNYGQRDADKLVAQVNLQLEAIGEEVDE